MNSNVWRMRIGRIASIAYSGLFFILLFLLISLGLRAPTLPYSLGSGESVRHALRPADMGDLQSGDRIIEFANQPFENCIYGWFYSPVFNSPIGKPVPVTYLRETTSGTEIGTTSIILGEPDFVRFPYLIFMGVVGLVYVISGALMAIAGKGGWVRLGMGTLNLLGGVVIAANAEVSGGRAPGLIIYQLGLPVVMVLANLVFSRWPSKQSRFWLNRVLLAISVAVALPVIALELKSGPALGCLTDAQNALANNLWLAMGILMLCNVTIPLAIGWKRASNPLVESQSRMLVWALGVGLGVPILLSMVPSLLNLPWYLPPGFALAATIIIPVATLFAAQEGTMIRLERVGSRGVFIALFLLSWLLTASLGVWAVTWWFGRDNSLWIAIVTSIPALLFSNVFKSPLQHVADWALYGRYYDYEEMLSKLTDKLLGIQATEQLDTGLIVDIPNELLIESAALWRWDRQTKQLRLVAVTGVGESETGLPEVFEEAWLEQVPHSTTGTVYIYHKTNQIGGDGWRIGGKLCSPTGLEGIILFGAKRDRRPYSDKDIRVLSTLIGWVANSFYARRMFEEHIEQESRIMKLLLAHEEEMRRKTAADLHDRGITSLGWVKRLLEKGSAIEVVQAAVQRVIDELRALSREQLNPFDGKRGLAEELENLVLERQHQGVKISFHVPADDVSAWNAVDEDEKHHLYYAVREAIENSVKADSEAPIKVSLERGKETFRIIIADQGPGFDASTLDLTKRRHRGLALMHARMGLIQGTMQIESKEHVGTTIYLQGPVKRTKQNAEFEDIADRPSNSSGRTNGDSEGVPTVTGVNDRLRA